MPDTLANSRFDRKPRRTTSRALNTCGNVSTWAASSSIMRPSVSSPRTGKKLSSRRMFSCRIAGSTGGFGCEVVGERVEDRQRALGGEVEDVGVLLLEHLLAALNVQGFCARKAACMY